MNRIRIGIYGYGNLGKGAVSAAAHAADMKLCAVFTRRNPQSVLLPDPSVPVISVKDAEAWKNQIDVMLVCGGSARDLPVMTPDLAKSFCVVDSFDTHANIPQHFASVNRAAENAGKLALISCGWDPGLFSLARIMAEAIVPHGKSYTFWGKGVSQGHSDAIRHIPGVADARQYTIPSADALDAVRTGDSPELCPEKMHTRECFVVLEPGADPETVEREIVTMPHYFSGYDTTVHFITQDELTREHGNLPHGGVVIRSGRVGANLANKASVEYSLNLESNPEFTSAVLIAYARAVYRMHQRGRQGCISVFDVAPADLSVRSPEDLRKNLL